MGKEFELKYAASVDVLEAVQAAVSGEYTEIAMETTYYDTPDGALSARKWTLRRRLENGVPVCTLKTPAQGNCRNEWEWNSAAIEDAVVELAWQSGLEELQALTAGGLVPVCGARFIRQVCPVTLPDGTVELALDRGVLFGGSREQPLAELEVEQKTATEEVTTGFAQSLAARFGMKPEPKSKFQRALDLTKGE